MKILNQMKLNETIGCPLQFSASEYSKTRMSRKKKKKKKKKAQHLEDICLNFCLCRFCAERQPDCVRKSGAWRFQKELVEAKDSVGWQARTCFVEEKEICRLELNVRDSCKSERQNKIIS